MLGGGARVPKELSWEPIERGLEIQEAWKLGNLDVWRLGISGFQNFKISRFLDFRISGLQDCKIAEF